MGSFKNLVILILLSSCVKNVKDIRDIKIPKEFNFVKKSKYTSDADVFTKNDSVYGFVCKGKKIEIIKHYFEEGNKNSCFNNISLMNIKKDHFINIIKSEIKNLHISKQFFNQNSFAVGYSYEVNKLNTNVNYLYVEYYTNSYFLKLNYISSDIPLNQFIRETNDFIKQFECGTPSYSMIKTSKN